MNSVIIEYLDYKDQIEKDIFNSQFKVYTQTFTYKLDGSNFVSIECDSKFLLRYNGVAETKKFNMEDFITMHPLLFVLMYADYYKVFKFKKKDMNDALRNLRTDLKSMSKTLRCQMSSPK